MEEMILHMWDASLLALSIKKNGDINTNEENGQNTPAIKTLYSNLKTYVSNEIHAGFVATIDTGVKKVPVIVFRGTDGVKDGINDLFANWATFIDGTNVHSGFYSAISALNGMINDIIISEALKSNTTIYLTGHSKGGAMATLMARLISYKYPASKLKVYTFGSPRVGDTGFANNYEKDKNINQIRIESFGDLVPHLPFAEEEIGVPNLYLDAIKKLIPVYVPQYISVGNYLPVNINSDRNKEKIAPAQSMIGTNKNDLNAFYVALQDFNADKNILGNKHTQYFPFYNVNRKVSLR